MATKQQASVSVSDSFLKRLGAQASIALDKKSDFIVGWEAANTEAVQAAINAYNERAVNEYAKLVLADLKL